MRGYGVALGLLLLQVPSAWTGEREAPLDLLGINFGEALAVEECPIRSIGTFQMYDNASLFSRDKPCFKRGYSPSSSIPDFQNGRIEVAFGNAPPGFRSDQGSVTMVDGKVESVWLYSYGLNVQDQILEALTTKYGPPTKMETETFQNRMGASFDGIEARWEFSNLRVSFSGLGSKIDTGYVTIETPVGIADAAAKEAARKAAAPKL